jgi:hypothetical protein
MAVKLEGTIGVCKDVLDIEWGLKPSVSLRLGSIMMDVFYQFNRQEYANAIPTPTGELKSAETHLAGIGFMMMF